MATLLLNLAFKNNETDPISNQNENFQDIYFTHNPYLSGNKFMYSASNL